MDPKAFLKYLIVEEFAENTNTIYETLKHDPLFNNGKNLNEISKLPKSDYLALCSKQVRRFTQYGFPSFALAMVDNCVISRLSNNNDVCKHFFSVCSSQASQWSHVINEFWMRCWCDVLNLGCFPIGNYLLKVNIRNTSTRYEICSKLTKKTPTSGVSVVNFEHVMPTGLSSSQLRDYREISPPIFINFYSSLNYQKTYGFLTIPGGNRS